MKKYNITIKLLTTTLLCGSFFFSCSIVKKISYANISVPEEGGINFTKITENADNVAAPSVRTTGFFMSKIGKINLEWWPNNTLALSPDGSKIAYLSERNKMCNIMVKSANTGGSSIQRTFRNWVTTFSWSPNGKKFCFTEVRNNRSSIYLVNATEGAVIRQISTGNANDFAGVLTPDENTIFFYESEGLDNYSLWSYDLKKNLFSNYSRGMNPCLIPGQQHTIYCSRYTDRKESEIWKVNFETGVEEVILTQAGRSFTTPQLSPDGKWILCTGSSITSDNKIQNTDIFVIRTDGNMLTQLTFHQGNDISPIWSKDGKDIFFISQRGNQNGIYNIWKMSFNL